MNQPAAYTPLESLFLFQSLLSHGVDSGAFARISELLKGNALIKSGDTYDAARLAPEALQQLFLRLLRDELKGDAERAEGGAAAGGDGLGSPGSRKRKLGSPPLPTLKEIYENIDRIPAIVNRLYARYREHTVGLIREDERRFATLQREIQLLERSEKERLAKVAASQNVTPTLAPRDPRAAAATTTTPTSTVPIPSPMPPSNGTTPSPAKTPAAPAGIRKGPTPNTPVPPPKPPISGVAAPKVTLPTQLAPAGIPTPQPTSQVLQPPTQQPPKQILSPRPEAAGPQPPTAPGAAPAQAGSLKWEKPYQPPQTTPGNAALQKAPPPQQQQQPPPSQQQWQRQPPQPQPQPQQQQQQPGPPRPTGPGATQQPQLHPQQQQAQQGQQTTPQHQHIQRAVQAQPSLLAQKFQHIPRIQTPRAIASATPAKTSPSITAAGSPIPNKGTPGAVATQRWQPGAPSAQQGARAMPSASPTAKPRLSPASPAPRTPAPSSPVSLKRGFGTKWASHSTPSTPGPITSEPESPAYEPVSPPLPRPAVAKDLAVKAVPKLAASKPTAKRSRGPSATPSATGTRRSQSVISQTDELSLDHSVTKVKKEVATPRLREETGDTTADESMPGRGLMATPSSMTRAPKRKRQDTPTDLQGPPTHVLWTRGFTKVSSSALDQISSHRDANMFATALREKDAPNYRQIVLQPQDITSIRSAIKAGNKAALQAAANLPGGDPGTASVWLPISDDLVPPRGIINSAHLERELVHMFCNAIMYNPDPDRGPGPAFMRRSQSDEEEVVGYRLDENGVVKNTQSMFLEVEKLLGDLRAAEKDRGIPPISTTRQGSVATPAEDTAEEEDELAGDGDSASASGTAKRRRISTRS
ncbi:hypothetical protein T069G_08476 [Trichoderma breve]|uniref:Bromo domain-containing protein n=1 Tax=Trichoderma breve TaxID=2034170 RepID=A0A9W9B7W1_9HYPO|nr:hypothetical protein T069G_08476 [Trichoderma breve]KAJ4857579.1 hypothetical protein T069G_08476 [Trichoderma breve]